MELFWQTFLEVEHPGTAGDNAQKPPQVCFTK
jgi:hypothetical protein